MVPKESGIFQCLGAIDGTHIPIKALLIHHSDYYNRKSFHSVILQGVCDSQCCFPDVFAGWPGRAHDSRVFGRSQIGKMITDHGLLITTSLSHFLSAIQLTLFPSI